MVQKHIDPNPDLLNIKEAAALLKVSEASLRRWTNAGRLACLRLGAKRERRFRREDLMTFMDDRQAPATSTGHGHRARANGAHGHRAEVLLEGIAIDHGNHICTLYESDLGRLKWSVPFLADGLRNGDGCFLIASPPIQHEILAQVTTAHEGVAEAREEGQLTVSEGIPDPQAMCDFVERSLVMATRSGTQSFRLIGDMTWCLRAGMTTNELIDYESRYNRTIARSFPLVSVCQYDVREFSGPAVLNALKCHEDTFSYPMSRFLAT